MTHNIYIYILIMAAVSYTIRVLPLPLIRKPLENQFLQSFRRGRPPGMLQLYPQAPDSAPHHLHHGLPHRSLCKALL